MARIAGGADKLQWAREVLARAQTAEQLRQAQAVVLPLEYGLSLEQTAQAIGRSVAWTCRLRNRLLAGGVAGDGGCWPEPPRLETCRTKTLVLISCRSSAVQCSAASPAQPPAQSQAASRHGRGRRGSACADR